MDQTKLRLVSLSSLGFFGIFESGLKWRLSEENIKGIVDCMLHCLKDNFCYDIFGS